MRAGRWLILAAIFAIIVFVGDTYFRHRTNLDALAAPRPLDLGLEASMDSWCYKSADGAKETFESAPRTPGTSRIPRAWSWMACA